MHITAFYCGSLHTRNLALCTFYKQKITLEIYILYIISHLTTPSISKNVFQRFKISRWIQMITFHHFIPFLLYFYLTEATHIDNVLKSLLTPTVQSNN